MKQLLICLLLLQFTNSHAEEEQKLDPWLMNPMSKYISKDKWNEMMDDVHEERQKREAQERMFSKGKLITIDTRDKRTCKQVQDSLRKSNYRGQDVESLCDQDIKNPYTSVFLVDEYRQRLSLDGFSSAEQNIIKQTRNFVGVGIGVVGLLWMMPESVSKWDKEDVKENGIVKKWKQNVKEGPVIDKDDWAINYIGHPVSGAAYYVVARHAGLSKWQSFGYSAFMSTFVWEYGVEAFAEVPSIQDLLSTPIIGSLMGEYMYQLEKKIEKNGGKLWGSKRIGGFVSALMNPAEGMLNLVNSFFEAKVIKSGETYLFTRPQSSYMRDPFMNPMDHNDSGVIGIGFEWKF